MGWYKACSAAWYRSLCMSNRKSTYKSRSDGWILSLTLVFIALLPFLSITWVASTRDFPLLAGRCSTFPCSHKKYDHYGGMYYRRRITGILSRNSCQSQWKCAERAGHSPIMVPPALLWCAWTCFSLKEDAWQKNMTAVSSMLPMKSVPAPRTSERCSRTI